MRNVETTDLLSLRKAESKDSLLFATIKAAAYDDDRSKSIPVPDQIPDWYYGTWYTGLCIPDEAEALRLFENYDCYLLLLQDKPIGIFWLHQEEASSLTLEDFCILPAYQNKGYGTAALHLIEEQFPENPVWQLSTPTFCFRNRHLYEKLGYQQIGTASNGSVILYEKRTVSPK
ncbi:GNAT family N-acetyltransferase [Anaerosporobacter faecicola]|uniref:GNAT family N-acetyltransferase n=1 Tax=Anaerosporobacter faecicola TaxID=2718714 RepID=UPI00143A99E5|nr:GNAT family N-acetyltransferase [Anaerosporobacter faecicola]